MINQTVKIQMHQIVIDTETNDGKKQRVRMPKTAESQLKFNQEGVFHENGFFIYIEEVEMSKTYTKFTNAGKISKSDDNYAYSTQAELEEAEKQLQLELAKFAETEDDMARAIELAEIINNADFSEELVTVSTKTSHSEWYKHGGEGNMRSLYHKKVPASVVEEAKELQAIRKKHQGNSDFDFGITNYRFEEVREADHDNF